MFLVALACVATLAAQESPTARLQQGCDVGNAGNCAELGILYEHEQGVAPDFARAATFYQRGCDRDNALGCTNLGALYVSGQGVAVDLAKAAALLQRACDAVKRLNTP